MEQKAHLVTTRNFALEANELINSGEYEQAIELCNEGLVLYPNYPSAYCVLAKAYCLSNQADLAANIAEKAIRIFPYNVAVKSTIQCLENGQVLRSENLSCGAIASVNLNLDGDYGSEIYAESMPASILFGQQVTASPQEQMPPGQAYLETDLYEEKAICQPEVKDIDFDAENCKENHTMQAVIEMDEAENPLESKQVQKPVKVTENSSEGTNLEQNSPIQATLNTSITQTSLPNEFAPSGNPQDANIAHSEIEDLNRIEEDDDEEALLLDNEVYFPKYTQQESIASILDKEDMQEQATAALDSLSTSSLESTGFQADMPPNANNEIYAENAPEVRTYPDKSRSLVEVLYELDLSLPRQARLENDVAFEFDYSNSHIRFSSCLDKLTFRKRKFAWHDVLKENVFNNETSNEKMQHSAGLHAVASAPSGQGDILSIAEGLKQGCAMHSLDSLDATRDIEPDDREMPLIVSETMARILVKQNEFAKAKRIYELLAIERSEKSDYYIEQASMLSR